MALEFYTSINEQAIIDAQRTICDNCGFPSNAADNWDIVTKAANEDLWFIQKPGTEGYGNFTQTEMISGIDMTLITALPQDPEWYPDE